MKAKTVQYPLLLERKKISTKLHPERETFPSMGYSTLACLSHFILCYRPSMQIAEWRPYPSYTMQDREIRAKVCLVNLHYAGIYKFGQYTAEIDHAKAVFNEEAWLILSFTNDKRPRRLNGEKNAQLFKSFDKVFLFDFFHSIIHPIK
ncbi:hypothetical protein HDC90_004593 [Pedobacter sp. AK013]|uniref:hypothetical protein n=1 Tax=Pedobacter sp. AK013 TaxID=2723071 RepID=UPI0016134903|nr:hypothetical protein [Pedobacter sp. AK013]MBB6239931.1 hypothetical protein [Pedobacter sp. AK013]